MSNSKISALTSATTPLAGTEVLPIVQSGATKQVSVANLTAGRNVAVADLSVTGNTTLGDASGDTVTINASTATIPNGLNVSSNLLVLDKTNARVGVGVVPASTFQVKTATNKNVVITGGYIGAYTSIRAGNDAFSALTGLQFESTHIALNGESGNGVSVGSMADPGAGNLYVLNNVVQGTAAKGINFTANTPAAGKTSQLLNWYEEGTWTPTQGAGLVVVGAFSSSGTYTRVGRQVTVRGSVSGATSIASAAGNVITAGLPFSESAPATGTASNAFAGGSSVCLLSGGSIYGISAIANGGGTIYFTLTYFV
jgi:formylmethanofuran dehydrogenase subunit C